jgi:hypothetical protein
MAVVWHCIKKFEVTEHSPCRVKTIMQFDVNTTELLMLAMENKKKD